MKKDQLENFIRNYREEMDDLTPAPETWTNIQTELKKSKKKKSYKMYSVAACVMLMLASAILIFQRKENVNYISPSSNIDNEVMNARHQYASLIEIKRNELHAFRKKQPELCNEFETQLTELNNMYRELTPQLEDENKKEIVIQAMIENLQMQLHVLDQQLEIMQKVNQKENDKEKTIQL